MHTVTFGPGGDVNDLGAIELPFAFTQHAPQRAGGANRRAGRWPTPTEHLAELMLQ